MRAACDQINVIHNAYLSRTTFQYKVLNNINRNNKFQRLELIYEFLRLTLKQNNFVNKIVF